MTIKLTSVIKWILAQLFYMTIIAGVMFIGWLVCYIGYLLGVL